MQALSVARSPGRKSSPMATALLAKAGKVEGAEAMRLVNQALCYSGDKDLTDSVLRKRLELLAKSGRGLLLSS